MYYLITILFLGLGTLARAADYHANIYTENVYLGPNESVSSQIRGRFGREIFPRVTPFMQVGQELFTFERGRSEVDWSSSFAYLAPGMRVVLGNFQLIGEGRVRSFYAARPAGFAPLPRLDGRLLLVYGNYFQAGVRGLPSTSLFGEVYSETVLTSADSANLIHSDFVRAGLRREILSDVYFDLFVEPFVTVDRVGHYYNNRVELRPSARLQLVQEGLVLGVIGSYTFNYYLPVRTFENNPYGSITQGLRVLAVGGVNL